MSTIINGTSSAITFPDGTIQNTAYISAGSVVQVVTTNLTSAFTSTVHGSWFDITGLAATITPKFATSKILVMVQLSSGSGGNNYNRGYSVKRGATQLNLGTYGSGVNGSFSVPTNWSGGDNNVLTAPFTYLDSPATTSATTYQVECYADSRSVTTTCINRSYVGGGDGNQASSTITLMEIAA